VLKGYIVPMTKADDDRKRAKSLAAALKTRSVSADRLKPPKPANNNAKSIDRWDDEGGAPSGGDRSARKRPRDPAAG
jgi:hypothetical protein